MGVSWSENRRRCIRHIEVFGRDIEMFGDVT
jgi:hypothetical protein